MPTLDRYGEVIVTVPVGQTLGVSSSGERNTVVSASTLPSNQPERFTNDVLVKNTAVFFGPYTYEEKFKISSNGNETNYTVALKCGVLFNGATSFASKINVPSTFTGVAKFDNGQTDNYINGSPVSPAFKTSLYVNIARGISNLIRTTQGADVVESHLTAIETALEPLIMSTAWDKIKLLWVPTGSTAASAMVAIKHPTAPGTALTNVGFLDADYSQLTGLTGNGTKYITAVNPSAIGMTGDNCGMACYTLDGHTTGLLASSSSPGSLYLGFATDRSNKANNTACISSNNGYPRMLGIQAKNGVVTLFAGSGEPLSSNTTTGVNTPGVVTIYSQGAFGYSNGNILGFALFDSLESSEIQVLNTFFDTVNYLIGRKIFKDLIAMGDSITAGSDCPSPTTNRYTALLAKSFGLTENNVAEGGTTLQNIGAVPDYWQLTPGVNGGQTSSTQGMQGRVVKLNSGALFTLGLGINDLGQSTSTPDNFIYELTRLINYLKSLNIPPKNILVMGITYARQPTFGGLYSTALAEAYNARTEALCISLGATFVPLFDLWDDSNYATYLVMSGGVPNGVHPNAAGHLAIYNRIRSVINANY